MAHRARIVELLAEALDRPPNELPSDRDLTELGLDSIARVELLAQLEDEFDLHVPPADAVHLNTLDAVVRYVDRHAD